MKVRGVLYYVSSRPFPKGEGVWHQSKQNTTSSHFYTKDIFTCAKNIFRRYTIFEASDYVSKVFVAIKTFLCILKFLKSFKI